LAIDLGLRLGFAVYGQDGRLRAYGSKHLANRQALKAAAWGELASRPAVTHLIAEGDASLAAPWLKCADKRGIISRLTHAEEWRREMLLIRDTRSGQQAKRAADEVARAIIEQDGAPRPTALRHDAAEAIVLGAFGARALGWRRS
jgi:hypothetical protein